MRKSEKVAEEAAKKAAEEAAAQKSDTPTHPEETKVDELTSCDCAAGHLCYSVDKVVHLTDENGKTKKWRQVL